tara:strand:+ start:61 stop:981 length:921 start_codon:yes stop_codon:yes gene_type:complete
MPKRIIFMGTPEFSVATLESLVKSKYDIVAVYSQPPKKAYRGKKVNSSAVENFARKNSLILRTPEILDSDEEYNFVKNLNPDIVIVVAYGKIIPKRFLNLSKYGFINVHASLLPKWRGAAPIQRSIMNLDTTTGISIMKIREELDSGPIMHQSKIHMNNNMDTKTLSEILSKLGAKNLILVIEKIENKEIEFKEQDHSKATYAKKISKEEGKIQWNDSAKKILGKINGLNPNPGAWFEYKNERYKVWKAKIVKSKGIAGFTIDNQLTIACKENSLQILEIQKEGKSKMSTEKFILGNPIKVGENIV